MFRRRKSIEERTDPDDTGREAPEPGPRAQGPWDASEVELDEDDDTRLDLGSLVLTANEALEVQLQVDEATEQAVAVLLAGPDGAAELRAFAAPRNGDIWYQTRTGLAAEVARMGGTASEADGPFGTALDVSVVLELPDGSHAQQDSRVLGISGPRWLLRVTLYGRPAVAFDHEGDVESAVRDVVVVRGRDPVPPGDPLPLVLPSTAQRLDL